MTCVCVHLRPGIQFSYDNEYDTMFQLHRSRSQLKLGPFKATIRNNTLAETLGSGQVRRSADSFCGMLWEVEWPLIGESFAATNSIVAVKAAQALLAILKLASQHWSTSW